MTILKKIHPVPSADGQKRYRAVWGHKKFSYFFTTEELKDLVKTLLDLLKGEPHKEWDSNPETLNETKMEQNGSSSQFHE